MVAESAPVPPSLVRLTSLAFRTQRSENTQKSQNPSPKYALPAPRPFPNVELRIRKAKDNGW